MSYNYRQAESERKAAIKDIKGTIFAADYEKGLYRVTDGEGWESNWLPLKVQKAGGDVFYAPLDIGEQVKVECPGGDPAQGEITGSFYSDNSPPPSQNPDKMIMNFKNGTKIEHDRSTNSYILSLPGGGTMKIDADGGTIWEGSINLNNGTITVINGDVIADGVSLKTHKHSGVVPGGAKTGPPA